MAKRIIINSAPPKPSKRIIGGSNQRSQSRLTLQGSYSWKYNHAPEGLDESKNLSWWREEANRYEAPLSSSGEILYGRQAVKRELKRDTDKRKLYNFDIQLDNSIKGGSNQPINKKYHLGNRTLTAFDSEINVSEDIYPNTKKRVSFGVTLDGKTYTSEQTTPFSLFSSSVSSGYQAKLTADGFGGVDFANLHDDKIQTYQGEVPAQGPFTERFVGGILARHNAPLRATERQESFNIVLSPSSVAEVNIEVNNGADPFIDLNGRTLTLTLGGVSYSATFNPGVNIADSTKTVLGIADAIDADGAAEAISRSLNLAASGDGLPVVASYGFTNFVNVKGTFVGTRDNGTAFGGTSIDAGRVTPTPTFSGGANSVRAINQTDVGSPQGKYLRGLGAKAPVNIENIKTLFTSDSVRVVGNYIRNYEVVQGSNRAATNMDLAYNRNNYNNTAPSAFITTPAMRTLLATGSADYAAPRQISTRKTNQTIIVNRFSAPGDKVDSKQQFRDVTSDQSSPNNALPFRNIPVRKPYISKLSTHTAFGGYELGSTTVAAVYKTQRNRTQRVQASGSVFITGSVFDDYFVTRPIPAGDSTQWFFSLSGSDTDTYSDYVRANSRYPEQISFSKLNIGSFNAGLAGLTGSDGNATYIWASSPFVAPWSQTRNSYKSSAIFLRKNNIYELDPEIKTGKDTTSLADSTKTRQFVDQVGNTVTNFYSQQFREPPITSRYKPLVHQIETFIGSPSETTSNKITLSLEYSYGNTLMGFANRELNRRVAGDIKFNHNKIKRPYEVLREQLNSDSSRSLNGVNVIKMFAYNETIWPKEVYTYLSGSRARLSFTNSYWRDDAIIQPVTTFYTNYNTLFYVTSIETRDNRQTPRLTTPFTTSQGYGVTLADQLPYNPLDSSTPVPEGPGRASIWPLDSYLWSDLSDTYAGSTYETGSLSASVILAGQASTPCGELMMTNFGTIDDRITSTDASKNTGISLPQVSDSVTSQYVYSIAFATGTLVGGNYNVEPRIPGGAFSRPPWTAGTQRVYVDGEFKGQSAEQVFPFYNSYEQWAQELRLAGKSNSIIPEYRISEHVEKFKNKASVFTAISSSLEITGANSNNFNGTNTDFYTRYATSDNMEFLSDFMTYDKGDVNYIFNDYPRHFEINSDAIMKLLPYEGFYPVNRTLQISTLYSQSYGPNSSYDGATSGNKRWRSLLRPFYAPGILYNSIKSGVSVDFPIRRKTRNKGGFHSFNSVLQDGVYPGYNIGYPLFGSLFENITISGGKLPSGTRRSNYSHDWSDPDVNALYWADRLPFESILAPEEYLTADVNTLTGSLATVTSDINSYISIDVTGSFRVGRVDSDNIYKKAISNFLANVPQFFLKTKENKFGSHGKMTKFVSQFGSPSRGSQEVTTSARTVNIDPKRAYMMEIGLMKTEQFNMYSNPAAFGPATNTSYIFQPWEIANASGSWTPSGSDWPTHRGEFAPFAPPYYYGPSLARITFMPIGDKTEYTLNEILDNDRGEVFVDYINESGSLYDASSGSFVDANGNTLTTNTTPAYKWNRAWLNRMDIDASINIGNEFPISANTTYKSSDPNKWTIMPKWESPVLDFPSEISAVAAAAASATLIAIDYASAASGQTIVVPTTTTTVTFEFDNSSSSPGRSSATSYTIGINGISKNSELAERIHAALALCLSNGEIDVTSNQADDTVSIISNISGAAMNSNTISGTATEGGGGAIVSASGFSGGESEVAASRYGLSSSVTPGEFTKTTQGMWHQYGQSPSDGRGIYLYIKDIPTGDHEEYDLVATHINSTGSYNYVKKVPKFVLDSGRTVSSLADLCGFDSSEIIRKGFDPSKAKRLGELAEDNENSISEAILALPFYLDESGESKLITLQASPTELGPKIKEFRKNFTKYSLPPALAQKLLGLVPKGFPNVPDTINPFGDDEYDELLSGEDIRQIPVVYLMEHIATLTKQDLADIWQGIMPDLSRRLSFSFSSIDHYMPGENVEDSLTQFPEVLKEQINIGAVRDGHPRYDLLDIAEKACKQGFFPEIKWLVFKVKQRGVSTYSEMIIQEVDGPNALGYDNSREFLTLQGLPNDQVDRILGDRDEFSKNVYVSKHSLSNPTFNWPYDYCSLLETVKIGAKVGFRPDLEKEYAETSQAMTQQIIDEKAGGK